MEKTISKYFIIASLYILISQLVASPAKAQNLPLSLSLSPMVKEIIIPPGQEKQIDFSISNQGSKKVMINLDYASFTPSNSIGQVTLTPLDKTFQDTVRYGNLLLPQELYLSPGEIKTIPLIVHVPKSTRPATYYIAILFTTSLSEVPKNTLIKNTVRTTSLLFLSVNKNKQTNTGKVIGDGNIASNFLYFQIPIPFSVLVHIEGNFSQWVEGKIVISDLLGRTISSIPIEKQIVTTLIPKFLSGSNAGLAYSPTIPFGLYRATLLLNGENGHSVTIPPSFFFIFPWQGIIGILIVIILFCLGILLTHRKT